MYRLTDDIAARRRVYPAPTPDMPSVLLIDVPVGRRGDALLLDRYYPVILETEDEVAEMEAWLLAPRLGPCAPDLFDRRRSQVAGRAIVIVQYAPTVVGWPWLVVCRWPGDADPGGSLARGCYSMEAFWSEARMADFCTELIVSLGRDRSLALKMISVDQLRPAGSA